MLKVNVKINERGGIDFEISASLSPEETRDLLDRAEHVVECKEETDAIPYYDDEAYEYALRQQYYAYTDLAACVGLEVFVSEVNSEIEKRAIRGHIEDRTGFSEEEKGNEPETLREQKFVEHGIDTAEYDSEQLESLEVLIDAGISQEAFSEIADPDNSPEKMERMGTLALYEQNTLNEQNDIGQKPDLEHAMAFADNDISDDHGDI